MIKTKAKAAPLAAAVAPAVAAAPPQLLEEKEEEEEREEEEGERREEGERHDCTASDDAGEALEEGSNEKEYVDEDAEDREVAFMLDMDPSLVWDPKIPPPIITCMFMDLPNLVNEGERLPETSKGISAVVV